MLTNGSIFPFIKFDYTCWARQKVMRDATDYVMGGTWDQVKSIYAHNKNKRQINVFKSIWFIQDNHLLCSKHILFGFITFIVLITMAYIAVSIILYAWSRFTRVTSVSLTLTDNSVKVERV